MASAGGGGVLRKRPSACERIEGFNLFGRVKGEFYESNRYSFWLLMPVLLIAVVGESGWLLFRMLNETVTSTNLEVLATGCADLGSFSVAPGAAGFPAGLVVAAHGAATRAGNPSLGNASALAVPAAEGSPSIQVCRGVGDFVELSAQVAFDGMFSGWSDNFCLGEGGLGHILSFVPGPPVEHILSTVQLQDMQILSHTEIVLPAQQSHLACRQGYAYALSSAAGAAEPLNVTRFALGGAGGVVTAALGCAAGGGLPLPRQRLAFDESGNLYVTCYTSTSSPEIVRLAASSLEVTGRFAFNGLKFAAGSGWVFAGPEEALFHLEDARGQELLHRLALPPAPATLRLLGSPLQASSLEHLAKLPEAELNLLAADGQGHAYLSLGSLAAFAPVRLIRVAVDSPAATPNATSVSLPAARGLMKDGVLDGLGRLLLLTGDHATGMHVFSVQLPNMEVAGDLALDRPWMEDTGSASLFLDAAGGAMHLWGGSHRTSQQWVMTLPLTFGPDTSMSSSNFWHGRLARSGGLPVNAAGHFPPHVSELHTLSLRRVLGVNGAEVLSLDPSPPNLQTGACLPGSVCLRFSLADLEVFEATKNVLTWQEWLGAIGGFWGLAMSSLGQVNGKLQDVWNQRHPPPQVRPAAEP